MSAAQTSDASAQAQAQVQAATATVAVEKRTTEPRSFFTSFSNMLGIGQITNRTLDAQRPPSQQTPAANAARRFGI